MLYAGGGHVEEAVGGDDDEKEEYSTLLVVLLRDAGWWTRREGAHASVPHELNNRMRWTTESSRRLADLDRPMIV